MKIPRRGPSWNPRSLAQVALLVAIVALYVVGALVASANPLGYALMAAAVAAAGVRVAVGARPARRADLA